MATFTQTINDLVGDFTDTTAMDQFLQDGLKQLYSILPAKKLLDCAVVVELDADPGTFTLDTATYGSVLSVTRKNQEGYSQVCRQIPSSMASKATNPDDLMYSQHSDPTYYLKGSVLNVIPAPSDVQTAEVLYLPLTVVSNSHSVIANLPNDLEYIVVLYAAVKCAESLFASEEDAELYVPMIQNLKNDYTQALQIVGEKSAPPPPQESGR